MCCFTKVYLIGHTPMLYIVCLDTCDVINGMVYILHGKWSGRIFEIVVSLGWGVWGMAMLSHVEK